jgi:hypothetical protein
MKPTVVRQHHRHMGMVCTHTRYGRSVHGCRYGVGVAHLYHTITHLCLIHSPNECKGVLTVHPFPLNQWVGTFLPTTTLSTLQMSTSDPHSPPPPLPK